MWLCGHCADVRSLSWVGIRTNSCSLAMECALDTDLALLTTKSTTYLINKTSHLAQAYLKTPSKFQQDLSLCNMALSNLSVALTIWSALPSGSISRIATKVRSAY